MSDFELADGALVVHSPSTRDWWRMRASHVAEDGTVTEMLHVVRGDRGNAGLQDPRPIPTGSGHIEVELTDYSGNVGVQRIPVTDL